MRRMCMISCGLPIRNIFIVRRKLSDSLVVHLLYKPTNEAAADWEELLDMAEESLPFIEKTFGRYPYKQFSFIHGGDGGMEYPMATLLSVRVLQFTNGCTVGIMECWAPMNPCMPGWMKALLLMQRPE